MQEEGSASQLDQAIQTASLQIKRYLQKEAEASCEDLEAFRELNAVIAHKLKSTAGVRSQIEGFKEKQRERGECCPKCFLLLLIAYCFFCAVEELKPHFQQVKAIETALDSVTVLVQQLDAYTQRLETRVDDFVARSAASSAAALAPAAGPNVRAAYLGDQ